MRLIKIENAAKRLVTFDIYQRHPGRQKIKKNASRIKAFSAKK